MAAGTVAVTWGPRAEPLTPCAVVGLGEAAAALGRRLLEAAPEGLLAVAGDDLLLLSGPEDALPWVDGLVWLGRDPEAAELLMPTTLQPSAPAALVQRALLDRFGADGGPWAVLPAEGRVVACATLRPLEPERLTRWLASRGRP